MKIALGVVIGVAATITLTYMIVSAVYAISVLMKNAASEKKKTVGELISDRIYSFAATIVVMFMALNLALIVCDYIVMTK